MTRKEFGEMRPGEFWEALAAYNDEVAADRRHIGELVRGAALRLFNIQVDKKYRISDPAKFWPMPWDESRARAEQDEIQRLENLGEAERREEVQKFLKRLSNGSKRAENEG